MSESTDDTKQERTTKRLLVIINCIMLAIGTPGGPLTARLYFIHGGNRIWLSGFLQSAGFPILLLPISISYIIRCRRWRQSTAAIPDSTKPKMVTMKFPSFLGFVIVGVLYGLATILYCYGMSRLPVSTSSLIIATQLAFTAVFALFMVRQKFTAYSVNAVVLLTIGAAVLAMHGGGDRPAGETAKQYLMGFVMTLLAAALFGFTLPLSEFVSKKSKLAINYSLMLEMLLVIGLFATLFNVVGMIIKNDFNEIPIEARHFGLGEANYYAVLVGSAILCQFNFLGAMGLTFCASSLLSGVMSAMLMPITEILGAIFFKEKFQAEKGVSLVLCLWGFASYFFGEFKQLKKMKRKHMPNTELTQNHNIPNP